MALPVLVWQIGDHTGESNDMLADCREAAIEHLRNGLLRGGPLRGGLGLALFFEPIAHLRIGEQSHQFLDLLWCRLLARRWLRGRLCRCETAARQSAAKIIAPSKIAATRPIAAMIRLLSNIGSS